MSFGSLYLVPYPHLVAGPGGAEGVSSLCMVPGLSAVSSMAPPAYVPRWSSLLTVALSVGMAVIGIAIEGSS